MQMDKNHSLESDPKMTFIPSKPYNKLPLLPPKAEIETTAILKKCIKSHTALATLKMAGQLLPNEDVLINAIPLLEAKDSSEIENIVTTTDDLFRQSTLHEKNVPHHIKEAIRYRSPAEQKLHTRTGYPISTSTAIKICQTIKGVEIDIRKTPGTTLMNDQTGEVIYVPPIGQELIRDKLANLELFMHGEEKIGAHEIDPLVRMSVMHYQFEAIHPFADGNGRTGRIMNILFLLQEELLELPILYLSRYILNNKADYYKLLLEVTEKKAWEPWIKFMLDAVAETADWTTERIKTIRRLMNDTEEYVKISAPSIYSPDLIDLIFAQPYCRIRNVIDTGIAKRQAASTYLKQLVKLGILTEEKHGREKIFRHPKFIEILKDENNTFVPYNITQPLKSE